MQINPFWSHHLQKFSSILWVVVLFMVSFAVQKLLSLIRSYLFIFIYIILGDKLKNIHRVYMFIFIYKNKQRVFCLCSSKSFIVSGLTLRSLIHFECIFVYGVWECSSFILLHVAFQFSQHHIFSIVYSCLLCHKLITLGRTVILTILILPIQEHGISYHLFVLFSISFTSIL